MKITDIQFEKMSFRFAQPMKVAFAEISGMETLFVKIQTDEGLSGLGEAAPLPFVTGDNLDSAWAVGKELREVLLGRDPAAIGGIHRRMDALYHGCGAIKCAIDMACYDIASKAAGMPLYRYLGGETGAVHSDVTIGIGTPDEMAEKALEWIEKGFTILKIKLGEDIETDLARMEAVRRAAGPSISLRIDANQGWSVKDSLRIIPELEELGVGSLRRAVEGDVDNGSMMAGQIAALVRERKTAKDVIDEIISEAEALCGLNLEEVAALNARGGRMLAGAAE